jgi:hypothetical protein
MNRIQIIGFALLMVVQSTVAQQTTGSAKWEITFPATSPANTWLGTHQRLCFGVDGKSLDEVMRDGTNVICGGTNAAGIGFAGGPFILGKDGGFVDIISGDAIPRRRSRTCADGSMRRMLKAQRWLVKSSASI